MNASFFIARTKNVTTWCAGRVLPSVRMGDDGGADSTEVKEIKRQKYESLFKVSTRALRPAHFCLGRH
jgi:hypothetical protein